MVVLLVIEHTLRQCHIRRDLGKNIRKVRGCLSCFLPRGHLGEMTNLP